MPRRFNLFLKQGIPKEQLEVTFHLAGKSVDGGHCLGRVSVFEDFKPVITKPVPGKLAWGISMAEYNPTDWLQSEIDELPEVTPEEVQKLAVRLVEHTAEEDGYVSGKYDMLTLSND